jgi:hypothetical protein
MKRSEFSPSPGFPIGFKLRNRTTSRGIAGSLSLRERVRVREDQGLSTL